MHAGFGMKHGAPRMAPFFDGVDHSSVAATLGRFSYTAVSGGGQMGRPRLSSSGGHAARHQVRHQEGPPPDFRCHAKPACRNGAALPQRTTLRARKVRSRVGFHGPTAVNAGGLPPASGMSGEVDGSASPDPLGCSLSGSPWQWRLQLWRTLSSGAARTLIKIAALRPDVVHEAIGGGDTGVKAKPAMPRSGSAAVVKKSGAIHAKAAPGAKAATLRQAKPAVDTNKKAAIARGLSACCLRQKRRQAYARPACFITSAA